MNLLSTLPNATLALLQQVAAPLDKSQAGSFWMPPEASTLAPQTDWIFYYIYWISVFFTALIVGVMIFFAIRYRHRKNWDGEKSASHGLVLEVTWSVIPFLLTVVMWWRGVETYTYADVLPANAFEVQVKARQWNWSFVYPNGLQTDELHIPNNQPVVFVLSSADVIHSFSVPAWRVKKDVVPGRYNKTWVEATVPGRFTLFCTEYCGQDHSTMLAPVLVHGSAEQIKAAQDSGEYLIGGMELTFDDWYAAASKDFLAKWEGMLPAEIGQEIYEKQCNACHSIDGTIITAPSWKGLWGKTEAMSDGSTVVVDENYVRESIYDPGAKLVEGYGELMTTYRSTVGDQELDGIIAYLKELAK
jgi:cytochrome c oxidase subunit 2